MMTVMDSPLRWLTFPGNVFRSHRISRKQFSVKLLWFVESYLFIENVITRQLPRRERNMYFPEILLVELSHRIHGHQKEYWDSACILHLFWQLRMSKAKMQQEHIFIAIKKSWCSGQMSLLLVTGSCYNEGVLLWLVLYFVCFYL